MKTLRNHSKLCMLVIGGVFSFSGFAQTQAADSSVAQYSNAQESVAPTVEELLSGYLENDLDLQKLAITAAKQHLSEESTTISNSYNFTLETGTISYRTGMDNSKSTVTFNPSATLDVPELSGLSITTTSEGNYYTTDAAKAAGNEGLKWTNSSISAEIDLISGDSLARKVSLLKAARSVLEAERELQNSALESEKEFYTKLKNIFSEASSVLSSRKDLYDAKIELEELRAQGYTASSSSYRTKELEVRSYEREVQENMRLLEKDTTVFANDCGFSYPSAKYADAFAFLPTVIPQTTAISVTSFPSDSYTETESALWSFYINDLDRQSNKDFSLSASGGYTADNTNTNSNSVDAGLSASWKGLSLNAGSSFGVGSSIDGGKTGNSFTLSVGLNPSTFKLTAINNKQNDLSEQEDGITLLTAQKNYETALLDRQTSLGDIRWSMQSNMEELDLYIELEKDKSVWFERGIITESEYLETLVKRETYELQTLMDAIDLIIYNAETKLLFCRDSELSLSGYENVSGVK